MPIDTIPVGQVAAPVISFIFAVLLYHYIGRDYLGADEAAYWTAGRQVVLSQLDTVVRERTPFMLTNGASDDEYIETVDMSSDEVARTLQEKGYVQSVLSGLKYRPPSSNPTEDPVSFEAGSMVFRESKSDAVPDVFAVRQRHVFWFENEDGTTDVYAHDEYSSLNPLFAWKHYIGDGQTTKNNDEITLK